MQVVSNKTIMLTIVVYVAYANNVLLILYHNYSSSYTMHFNSIHAYSLLKEICMKFVTVWCDVRYNI